VFAELVGTTLLAFVAAFAASILVMRPIEVSPVMEALAVGFAVVAIAYAFGHVSGAHINPIITWAFALRGSFPWRLVPFYWLAQLIGSFAGTAMVYGMLGRGPETGHLGWPTPFLTTKAAFSLEIVLTFFLVIVELGTATGYKVVGSMAGLAVGFQVAVAGLIGNLASGAVMHPFIALALGTVAKYIPHYVWIYLVGPPIGSTIAAIIMLAFSPYIAEGEMAAALGDAHRPKEPYHRLAQPGAMERDASREIIA
jgi:aquaporin Z